VATAARKRGAITVRRSGASNAKVLKLQNRIASLSKRGAKAVSKNDSLLCSVGAAAGLAMLEKRGTRLPAPMGLDPALVLGAAAYLLGSKVASGKTARRIEAAGEGLLAVAAARSVQRGSVKVAGDEIVADDEDELDDDDDE
jgi:hypothetical protein